jgi:hypothetical protein
MSIRFITFCAAVAIVAALPVSAVGQSNATDGALDGFVRDATAAFLPSVRVIAVNVGTGQVHETVTSDAGYYRFPLLQVGEYELLATAPGFAEHRQSGIRLSVGQQVRLDVVLGVAGASEAVTVTADASILLSGQASSGEVLNERAVRTLPIVSRNVYNFHLAGPGVKGIPSTGFGTTQFLVGGASRMQWSMDGLDNSQRRGNRQIRLVISTPENVEEMQVMSGAYSAEFGRAAGGAINVVSRSGTNQLRGSAMALYRPNAWSARPPLAAVKPDQEWWMMQGSVGGPLRRDRMFLFANYEYNPLKAPQPVTIAPAVAQALQLPASDLGNSPFGETFHTPSVKVNYRASDRNSGFLRYNRFTNDQPGAGGGLTTIGRSLTFKDRMYGIGGQLATVVGPTLLNELRVGFNRRSEVRTPYAEGSPDGAQINITGVANFGANPLAGSNAVEASLEVIDNVTWTRGAHTFKGGIDYQTTGYDAVSALGRVFVFSGLPAAGGRAIVSPLDQYLRTVAREVDPATGRPYSYTQLQQDLGDPALALRFHFLNLFVQDEWRLHPFVTLSAGLRYEMITFPKLDPEAPFPLSREIRTDGNNLAPRIGVTWLPGGDPKTQIKGGYGLFYDSPSLNLALSAAQQNGRRILSYQVPGSDLRSPVFPSLLASGDASFSVPPSIVAFPSDFDVMFAHQANLQVARELARDLSLTVAYSYWGHRHGPYLRDTNLSPPVGQLEDGRPVFSGSANRPNPQFRAINLVESNGRGSYHGADITVRRRFSHGLQLSSTYSYARARSDSDLEGGAVMDPSDVRRDWGASSGDVRHTLVAQWSYAPQATRRGLRWATGFELSALTFYNSGFPINTLAGVDLNSDLVLNDRRPFRARNDVEGPSFLQTDVRLVRRVTFGGQRAVEVILESENVFNRLNASCSIAGCTGAVVNRDGASDFGRITSTRPGRNIQLGTRVTF